MKNFIQVGDTEEEQVELIKTWWNNNGQIDSTGTYTNGLKNGKWTFWDMALKQQSEVSWRKGEQIGDVHIWDENGRRVELQEMRSDTTEIVSNPEMVPIVIEIEEQNLVWKNVLKAIDEEIKMSTDGKWVERYANGEKKLDIRYKKGKKNGKWTYWYVNGNKRLEGGYKKGVKHGKWIYYFENGSKNLSESYKNGKKNGKRTVWYVNGGKEKEASWENDELDGSWKEWYMNGQIRVKGSYTKGREHGEWIYWYQNGEKMIEAEIDG